MLYTSNVAVCNNRSLIACTMIMVLCKFWESISSTPRVYETLLQFAYYNAFFHLSEKCLKIIKNVITDTVEILL